MEAVQMSPVSMLALMNSNKSQRNSFCLQIVEQVENGEVDPIQCHVFLKSLEAIFKTLTDEKTGKDFAIRYKAALLDAVEKEGAKSFEKYNAKFQVAEVGVKYNYDNCNDPIISGLHNELKELEAKIEERESFLKAVPLSGQLITDENTGETNKVYPPSKSSTSSIKVTLS